MSSAGNLIAYWPFDEGAGSVAQDSSGNGHHGTLHNVDWATGVSGSGLALHGEGVQFESFATGSHVSTPLRLSIDDATGLTISAWFKTTASFTQGILENYVGSSAETMATWIYPTGNLIHFNVRSPGLQRNIVEAQPSKTLNDGQWHHIAFVRSPSSIQIYLDGALQSGSILYDDTLSPYTQQANLYIGATNDVYHNSLGHVFSGILDEVKVYNYALSAAEVQQEYAANPPSSCQDECSTGSRTCSGSGYKACGNSDSDTCLEWSAIAPCADGQVCHAGTCVPASEIPPCVDDCAPGPKACWRNGFRGCANFDDDPCLEWSEVTNCPGDQRCANGVCAPLPPREERCVTICHRPEQIPPQTDRGDYEQLGNSQTICVAPDALQAHHEHGDYLGECVLPDEKERDREIRNIIEKLEARRPKEIPILRPDMPIEKITIEVDEEFTRVELVFRNTERPPQDVPAPERKVLRYIEIEHPEIGNEKVTSAKLDFKVEHAWLQEQGASLEDVVLTRFKDGAWQDLATRNVRSDANYEYFEADSAGLSVFAITVRTPEPVAEPAQEIPVQPPVSLLSITSQTSLIGIAAFLLAGGALGAMLLSRRSQGTKVKRPAPSAALVQYVRSCRAKGFSESRIRKALLQEGWNSDQVDASLRQP